MSKEGSKDRPGNNHLIKVLRDQNWNYYTNKASNKVKYINKTGAVSVRGELVKFDPANNDSVILTAADDQECIGAFAEDGIPDGDEVYIITGSSCQYMLKDGTASTAGNWIKTSDVAGRADASLAAPPGGGVVQLDQHMQEVGHSSQTVGSGTDVLCRGSMHLN